MAAGRGSWPCSWSLTFDVRLFVRKPRRCRLNGRHSAQSRAPERNLLRSGDLLEGRILIMMSWTLRHRLLCPLLVIVLTGCSSSSPSTPSRPVDVSGTWTGEQTFTSISGGDCLGPALQDVVGLPSQ